MDKLNIDFKSLKPYVIDAFSSVYGEEYRPFISKKINNSITVSYNDVTGLSGYVFYLMVCKRREFSIRFLDSIGIDVQQYKNSNYTEPLDDNVKEILDCLIDSCLCFGSNPEYWAPVYAFDSSNKNDPNILLKRKIKIINFLLGNTHEKITEENFEDFSKTKKFEELLEKINKFKMIYDNLLSEYRDWTKQLEPYTKYIDEETKREEGILQKKKDELFREIFDKLPPLIKAAISNKTFEEQQEIILGTEDISFRTDVEEFRHEQMEILRSSDAKLMDKCWIKNLQSKYLNSLGISVPEYKIIGLTEEDVQNYLLILHQDNVRKYIPTEELISYISSTREKKYEEALREYYTTRKDFLENIKSFANNQNNFDCIYEGIKNKKVCILMQGATNGNNEFISIMFYTIRANDGGFLLDNFVHENGHVIDQNQRGCGFEVYNSTNIDNIKNPHDNAFRKYERFNEALNDIFTTEAVNFLQSQEIYLIEPYEFTQLDTSNCNTAAITKDLLKPLVQKFRKQVIKAKINSDPQELTQYIGEENFEELVDAVNKVDYLSRNGVVPKIDNSPEDPMVIDYFEQVERVKQIYINIDDYYASKSKDLSVTEHEEETKKR